MKLKTAAPKILVIVVVLVCVAIGVSLIDSVSILAEKDKLRSVGEDIVSRRMTEAAAYDYIHQRLGLDNVTEGNVLRENHAIAFTKPVSGFLHLGHPMVTLRIRFRDGIATSSSVIDTAGAL